MTRAALLVLLAGHAIACGPTFAYARYRVPLDDEEGAFCARRCEVTHDSDEDGLFQCLEACPGIEITVDRTCSSRAGDHPPESLCYTAAREVRTASSDEGDDAGNAMFDILGAIIEGAIDAAVSDDDEESDDVAESGGDDEAEPSRRARTAKRSRTPAEPRRARRPADPKRK